MLINEVVSKDAPAAVGPYSQAINAGGMIFCAGQIAKDPKTDEIVRGTIKEQTKRVMDNLSLVLEAAGTDLDAIVKTTVFLKDMSDYEGMNEVYGSYFKKPYPARSTVQVVRLPKDVLVEIECIAFAKELLSPQEGCCGGSCGGSC